jgi:hypothetical protein
MRDGFATPVLACVTSAVVHDRVVCDEMTTWSTRMVLYYLDILIYLDRMNAFLALPSGITPRSPESAHDVTLTSTHATECSQDKTCHMNELSQLVSSYNLNF